LLKHGAGAGATPEEPEAPPASEALWEDASAGLSAASALGTEGSSSSSFLSPAATAAASAALAPFGEDLGLAASSDPVYRYDPERARYTAADLGASVPVILGIREYTVDYREAAAAAAGAGRRFTTWKVAAKQKIAQELWAAWKASVPKKGGSGGGSGNANLK
jgi:hypothetical protein